MRINKFAVLMGFVFTAILLGEVVAHAGEMDQFTNISFSQPVEIPGQTLPAVRICQPHRHVPSLECCQVRAM